MYSELDEGKGKGHMLHTKQRGQPWAKHAFDQISIKPTVADEYAIIVLEKNWAEQKKYYEDLGLLNNGSIVHYK